MVVLNLRFITAFALPLPYVLIFLPPQVASVQTVNVLISRLPLSLASGDGNGQHLLGMVRSLETFV